MLAKPEELNGSSVPLRNQDLYPKNDVPELSEIARMALKAETIRGFKAIPKRGAEVGGLLCGQLVEQEAKVCARIDSIVPFEPEYRFGPGFRLSPLDMDRFRDAMRECSGARVIGWYRSHTRIESAPVEEDRALSAELFPESASAFLICYPQIDCSVDADLCIWNGGRGETTSRLQLGRFSLVDQALQPLEVPVALAPSAAAIPPRYRTRRTARIAALAVLATSICSAGLWLYARRSTPTGTAGPALELRVDPQESGLLVSWNHEAPQLLTASGADLTITDHDRARVTKLTPRQLRAGGLLYANAPSGDARVELDIQSPAGHFAQSIRIISAGTEPPSTREETRATWAEDLTRKPTSASKPDGASSLPRKSARPGFAPPPANQHAPGIRNSPLILSEAPEVSAGFQTPAHLGALGHVELPPGFPALAAAPQGYVPPRPKKKVDPSLPAAAAGLLSHNLGQSSRAPYVEVAVMVNERGKVIKSHVVNTNVPLEYSLATASLTAAGRWTFEPATRGGNPVPGESIVRFDFVVHPK